jgi:hypothetical protein
VRCSCSSNSSSSSSRALNARQLVGLAVNNLSVTHQVQCHHQGVVGSASSRHVFFLGLRSSTLLLVSMP